MLEVRDNGITKSHGPAPRIALTVAEAAQACGRSVATLNRWTHIKGFPVRRIGGCTLILADEFKAWIMAQEANA